ncbi:MAG: hypothetical protein ABSC48_00600 [Terracidiphilus sp.]|jgi:hypothetical protein
MAEEKKFAREFFKKSHIMQLWRGYNRMGKSEHVSDAKGNEILRQMREDTGSKKHLDHKSSGRRRHCRRRLMRETSRHLRRR